MSVHFSDDEPEEPSDSTEHIYIQQKFERIGANDGGRGVSAHDNSKLTNVFHSQMSKSAHRHSSTFQVQLQALSLFTLTCLSTALNYIPIIFHLHSLPSPGHPMTPSVHTLLDGNFAMWHRWLFTSHSFLEAMAGEIPSIVTSICDGQNIKRFTSTKFHLTALQTIIHMVVIPAAMAQTLIASYLRYRKLLILETVNYYAVDGRNPAITTWDV